MEAENWVHKEVSITASGLCYKLYLLREGPLKKIAGPLKKNCRRKIPITKDNSKFIALNNFLNIVGF